METQTELHCEMTAECAEPVTMLDEKGWVYCTNHGIRRQYWHRCRKLRPAELRKLQRGEVLEEY